MLAVHYLKLIDEMKKKVINDGFPKAVRNAFSENKYKFPALSDEEREEVKECFLEILREEAEKLKNEEGRGRRKREIMVFYQEN